MKKLSVFLLLLFLPAMASAHSYGDVAKSITLGIGTYGTIISYDDDPYHYTDDDEFSGLALSIGHAVSDQFSFRLIFYSLEHDDYSDLESKGFDLLGHVGVNLATQGFKAYIGGGFFRDEWELGSYDKTFDGLQLNGGIGYNWNTLALDLIVGLRDASDYEDFINDEAGTDFTSSAGSVSLLLSIRL